MMGSRENHKRHAILGSRSCRGLILPELTADALRAFGAITRVDSYPKGATLCDEGQVPRGLLVIEKGKARLSTGSSRGSGLFLGVSQPGEILGLSETISGKPYELTAVALETCEVGLVERNVFLKFLLEQPEVCFRALKLLGKDLGRAYKQARSFGKPISGTEE